MEKLNVLIGILGVCILTAFSCEKDNNEQKCYAGRVIQVSCGGTVIQLLSESKIIGETWENHFKSPSLRYENCVLAGNLPAEKQREGDTIHFSYKKVASFSEGNFCDIGGLPITKIEILKIFNQNCSER